MSRTFVLFAVSVFCFANVANAQQPTGWKAHDKQRPQPEVVDSGEAPAATSVPSDAIVLFDGTDLSKWAGPNGKDPKWKVADGVMECFRGAGFLYTKEKFGDIQLHLEWASPSEVKGNGQGRGNSGVFLPGGVEVQVLDSFENETYADGGAASIYGQYPPLVNASRGPGKWQTYDIIYQLPRFDENKKQTSPAVVTVLHNGVVVQHATRTLGPTSWVHHREFKPGITEGTIGLQDHGNPVRFRNIWVRKMNTNPAPGKYPEERSFTEEEIKNFVGKYKDNCEVKFKDNKLWLHTLGQDMEIVAYADGTFSTKESAGTISFESDSDGNVASMKFKFDAGFGRNAEKRKPETE
jgi:hypothetical protein